MRGLNKLYWLKIDIENINEQILTLPIINSPQITGMPHGSGVSNPIESYCLKKEKLVERLNKKLDKLTEELIRLEDIIERIDVPEIKTMARMRFIDNKSWEYIGSVTNYDRSVCYRKVKKYIEGMDI